MFDMTQCEIGDKLITREGEVVVFIGDIKKGSTYPYGVETDGGYERYYGSYGEFSQLKEHYHDIIGFAHQSETNPEATPVATTPKITIVAKPSFVLSIAGKDVELTLDELKDLGAKIINLIGEE